MSKSPVCDLMKQAIRDSQVNGAACVIVPMSMADPTRIAIATAFLVARSETVMVRTIEGTGRSFACFEGPHIGGYVPDDDRVIWEVSIRVEA